MIVRELKSIDEMLEYLPILQQMYPSLDRETYDFRLKEMLPFNYGQIGFFIDDQCIAISGYWIHTKLWIGKILELDNVIVDHAHRGKGAGKQMQNYLEKKARESNCQAMVLDAFVQNFSAHKFYYNEGYVAKGYHFVKPLDPKIQF